MEVAERRAELHESRLVEFSLFSLPIQTQAVYGVHAADAHWRAAHGAAAQRRRHQDLWHVHCRSWWLWRSARPGCCGASCCSPWSSALGLGLRFYLEKLRLLLVPRLAAVLTLVVLMMAGISVLSHRLGIETGLSVALFPLVILTMAIERMSIVWEERGPAEAIQEGLGSLLVAAVAYLVMSLDVVSTWSSSSPSCCSWCWPPRCCSAAIRATGCSSCDASGRCARAVDAEPAASRWLEIAGCWGSTGATPTTSTCRNPRRLFPLVDDKLRDQAAGHRSRYGGAGALRQSSPSSTRSTTCRGFSTGARTSCSSRPTAAAATASW